MKTKLGGRHYFAHCAHNLFCSVLMSRNNKGGTNLNLNYEQMDLQTSNVTQFKAALNAFLQTLEGTLL